MFVHLQTAFNERGMHYVFNHIDIELKFHDGSGEDWDGSRLMSAKVTPRRYVNLVFMILITLGPSHKGKLYFCLQFHVKLIHTCHT